MWPEAASEEQFFCGSERSYTYGPFFQRLMLKWRISESCPRESQQTTSVVKQAFGDTCVPSPVNNKQSFHPTLLTQLNPNRDTADTHPVLWTKVTVVTLQPSPYTAYDKYKRKEGPGERGKPYLPAGWFRLVSCWKTSIPKVVKGWGLRVESWNDEIYCNSRVFVGTTPLHNELAKIGRVN